LAAACLASAGEGPLSWKFKAGDEADIVVERKQVRAIDLGGNQLEIGSGSTLDVHWKVDSVDEKGTATLTAAVVRLQMEMTSPIAQFEFDSMGEEPEGDAIWEEIGERIKKFVGSTIKLVVAPSGKVEKVEFAPEVVEALNQEFNNPQIGRFVGSQFDEKGLGRFVGECFARMPEGKVEVGETWEDVDTQSIPRMGDVVVTKSHTYKGENGSIHLIEVVSKVELKPAEGGDEESSVDLREQEGKGLIEFDAAKGRASKSEFVQKMTMDLSRDGNDISIESTETTIVREGKSEAPAKAEAN
jgi:hypothetical protein